MSFKGTTNSIASLKDKSTPITTNELLKMMEVAAEDVFEHNGVAPSVRNLKADDPKAVLLSSLRLLNTLLTICEDNQDSIAQLSAIIQRKLGTARAQASGWQQEWSALSAEIAAAEQEAQDLRSQLDQLEARRGHLLALREYCSALREKIDVLNDPRLDQIAAEKAALEADFSRRCSIAAERKDALHKLRDDITHQQAALDELNTQITADTAALAQYRGRQEAAQREKDQLTEEVQSVSGQCRALQEWLDNFPAWSQGLYQEFRELQDRSTVLLGAWNSLWNDQFLRSSLNQLPQDARERVMARLSIPSGGVRTIQELEEWFRDVCLCVRELTAQCEDKLQALIAQAQSLTAPVSDTDGGI